MTKDPYVDKPIQYVADADIKLRGERVGASVLITLPCGQKRRMHREQFRNFMQRGNDLLAWLDNDSDKKDF